MAQKKLLRFAAIESFPNVLQYPTGMAGQWHSFFNNSHPVVLELACGRGEYTEAMAAMHPKQNHIGVDLKGNRIYIGAKNCIEKNLKNAAFLRTKIEKLTDYFSNGEVLAIWLTFPDPQLRGSKAKKRLTHPAFLRLYQHVLKPGGSIHLKTDSPDLYAFTLMVIEMYGLSLHKHTDDLYAEKEISEELKIITHYERLDIAKSRRILYLCFSLPQHPLPDLDHILQQRIKANEPAID